MSHMQKIFFGICIGISLFIKGWGLEIDFAKEMGKGSSQWSYLETKEDFSYFSFFESLYRNQELTEDRNSIPKVFHIIWLGPLDFSEDFSSLLTALVRYHEGWKVKLWMDCDRDFSFDGVEKVLISAYPFSELTNLYYDAENIGEKARLLSYEILYQEGGVYLDHDVQILRSIDPLTRSVDFFCGLEVLGPSVYSSSVFPSNHLIASKPFHPILQQTMSWLKKEANTYKEIFSGTQPSMVLNRVKLWVCAAFHYGVQQGVNQGSCKDIVFPSSYFSREEKADKNTFCLHKHLGSWHQNDVFLERKTKARLQRLLEKSSLFSSMGLALVITQSFFLLVFIFLLKKRRN